MKKASLPSYRDSRILIQALFDPFSLSPVDIEWLEKKNRLKIPKGLPKPKPVRIKVGRKVAASSSYSRRKEREAKADGLFTSEEWEQLKAEYDFKCLRCGDEKSQIVPDHIRPLYRKGSGLIQNIQPLCSKCNIWKGLKIIDYRPGFAFEII